jgi:hypothetical protein
MSPCRCILHAVVLAFALDAVQAEQTIDGCPYYRSDELGELARTLFIPSPSVEIISEDRLNEAYVRRLPCHTRPLPDHEERFHRTDSWRDPPIAQLCCLPPGGCFRAVFDDRLKLVGDGSELSADQRDAEIIEQVKGVLVSDLGFGAELIGVSTSRRQATDGASRRKGRSSWHADYYTDRRWVFSAIVYFGASPAEGELVGGWTGFVDTPPPPVHSDEVGLQRAPNGTALLRRGLIVAPRYGRLVVFSSGGENIHAALPVAKGKRTTLQIWFWCTCTSSQGVEGEL